MNPEPPASVFASYSRKDARLVKQLLGLYRAIDMPTFVDEQSIKPGQKWRVEINAALEQCQTILVFWCGHAAQSAEVRGEYEYAIALGKRVVPVLIDHTALPPDLAQYQGVDLRAMFAVLSQYHDEFVTGLEQLSTPEPYPSDVRKGADLALPAESSKAEDRFSRKQVIEFLDLAIANASRQLESSLNFILDQR